MTPDTHPGAGPDQGLLRTLPGTPAEPAPVAFGNRGRALPEPPGRKRLVHTMGVITFLVSIGYLSWRAAFTIDLSMWFVALLLLFLEIHHALGLFLYTFSLWDVDPLPGWKRVDQTDLSVAILIPTYDEDEQVLLPVIAAAVSITPRHETWVLDDGNRPSVERLAEDLGARYVAREENVHAKAGNINNALPMVDADVLAVLDADHVVMPDFLHHTLCYFEDPEIAVVQTPQDFYNVDSFEHAEKGGTHFSEQAVFYRVILPAKNRWNAVFWCGTNAVVRKVALDEVGGVATGTVTEDIHTSIRLHRKGWKIIAHNEVLAVGLAAGDVNQYMLQRRRWARGALQVMRAERPITAPGLTLPQRLAYASTLFGWFDVWRSLGYVLLPMLVLATGSLPIVAPLAVFGPLFLATFAIQFTTFRFLARGYYPPILSMIFESLRLPAVLPATAEIVKSGSRRFGVTPKGRVADDRKRNEAPVLLVALFALGVAAMLWFGLTIAGLTPLTYRVPGAAIAAAVFLALNLALLIAAVSRARNARYAGERRASVRFPTRVVGTFGESVVIVEDLSLGGARLRMIDLNRKPEEGERATLAFGATGPRLEAEVVRIYSRTFDGSVLGVRFDEGQHAAESDLALWLFHDMARTAQAAHAAA